MGRFRRLPGLCLILQRGSDTLHHDDRSDVLLDGTDADRRERRSDRRIVKKVKTCFNIFFPQIPPGHVANEQIAANMIANIFGLGWAATPAGLEAMESLEELEESRRKEMEVQNGAAKRKKGHRTKPAPVPRGTANAEMCTFLIMNISSLQLIPVNIIAFRSQYGSVNPAEIIGPRNTGDCY